MSIKGHKSLLFVPGSRSDMIDRAHERQADVIIIDLEDGVADADKRNARESLSASLKKLRSRNVTAMVRINALENGGDSDLIALTDSPATQVLVPKVSQPQQLLAVLDHWHNSARHPSELQLLPMIECPSGLFNAQGIASASANVCGLVFGSEDFAAEAGLSTEIDALATPAQWVALAAAAAGIPAYGLPGSLGNYHDITLFQTALKRAKTIGFSGTLCIHPNQVIEANTIFKPSQQEVEWALTVMNQSAESGASGGAAGMIDAPVVKRAQAILDRQA